jgi:hypothetical protein
MKPGEVHSGSFKPGHDPRRGADSIHLNGKSLSAMARELTPECLVLMHNVVRGVNERGADVDYPIMARLRASEYILNRGWGTAVQNIELSVSDSRPINALTRAELLALAAGEQPRLPVLLPAETVPQAVPDGET